jgi:hypothetical protein
MCVNLILGYTYYDYSVWILKLGMTVDGRCNMTGSDKDCGRSRRPGAEVQEWSSTGQILGGRTVERSGDAVCGLHCARGADERMFLGLASKPRSAFCWWFDLKTARAGFPIWASKLTVTV